ncbi:MAG: hypothetical protein HGA51_04560 [Demequinaceae bacterium]|nr:hypothetical protein [Demequinaceae bacterium]
MRNASAVGSEYDRFGPWIDEVTRKEDLPRLYRDYPIDFDASRLVLKVPRNITHRNATPEMDLYDHVITLGQDQLTVLSRRLGGPAIEGSPATDMGDGKGYNVVTALFADVVAIRDALNLLSGRLTVSTSEGTPIKIAYNGSAADAVARLVGILKEVTSTGPASSVGAALLAAAAPLARPAAARDQGPVEPFLATAFLEAHFANPRLSAWATHGSRRVAPEAAGLRGTVERLRHALSPMTLHGALFAADDAAMEVFGRHSWLIRGKVPTYSRSHLVIPFSAPDHLDLAQHPLYPDVTVATIGAGKWRQALPVPRGSVAERLLHDASSRVPLRGRNF